MPINENGIVVPFGTKPRVNKKIEVVRGGVSQEVTIPWWVTSPEQEKEKQKLLEGQFFILRQGELGEVFKCTRCGGKHRYFTLMCIERPFDGLKEGLQAYYHHVGKHGSEKFLSTLEYQRYEEIHRVVSRFGSSDLAGSHPQYARGLQTGDDDYDIGSVALGLLEPITRAKATALAWNINARGLKPPFALKGLEQ